MVEIGLMIVAPAVAWLLRTVNGHSNTIAALVVQVQARAEIDERVIKRLDSMDSKLDALHGDQRQVLERTDWLIRTTDRHERFLEAGRLDKEAS